jgi:FkbM family methyltransferase
MAATRPPSSRVRPAVAIAPPTPAPTADTTRGNIQTRPRSSQPLPIKAYARADAAILRGVIDGVYDAPGLEFDPPPIILDIGSHVGAASVWFSKRYPRCTIHAYEPHPQNVAAFLTNTANASARDITLHPVAVVGSKWDATTTLFEAKDGYVDHAVYDLGNQKPTGITVRTMKASDLPTADVLKISAPGCEVEILEGYPHIDEVQAVLLDFRRPTDHEKLLEWLSSRGFFLCKDETPSTSNASRILLFIREDEV